MKIQLIKLLDNLFGVLGVYILSTPEFCVRKDLRRILLIRPGGIGDAVLLIPAILELKKNYPDAEITVLAEKRNGAVFNMCSQVDRLLMYDRPKQLFSALRDRYDVVIDTEQWHRLSAVVARLTNAPVAIGFSTNERMRLFTHPIPYSHDDYETTSFFNLLTPLDILPPSEVQVPFLFVQKQAKKKAVELLKPFAGGKFVTIFPGASIAERRWDTDRFVKIAERFNAKGIPVVVVGAKEDNGAGGLIVADRLGLNLAGQTSLMETAAVIEKSTLLLSGDSGILHIGAGLGKPTVSLFGPGIEKKWAPKSDKHIVINKCLPCSPCTKFGYTPNCPINANCMAEIQVDDVFDAIESLLELSIEG